MKGVLDRLNLRPAEQRLVVIIGTIVFVVLNLWFVKPHFGDWAKHQESIRKTQQKLAQYHAEVARIPDSEAKLKALEGAGAAVVPEEQLNTLLNAIQTQASQSRVIYTGISPRDTRRSTQVTTNQFFDERAVLVNFVNTGDAELLDFLINLSTSELMVRVRDLDIRPDPSSANAKLAGSLTLVASYKKNTTPSKTASTAKKP